NFLNITIKDLLRNVIKFSIIPLFIINTYTFSIWIELIIVPLATMLTIFISYSENKKEHKSSYNVLVIFTAIFGCAVFVFSLRNFWLNVSDIKDLLFWKTFSFELILYILHLPLFYLIQV